MAAQELCPIRAVEGKGTGLLRCLERLARPQDNFFKMDCARNSRISRCLGTGWAILVWGF
jgi:hypothetical protein